MTTSDRMRSGDTTQDTQDTSDRSANSGQAGQMPASMKLVKLSDAGLTVTDPAEDIRGRKVMDQNGEEVGDVDDLLMDERERKVRFMRVATGGFLGLGETKFLLPVDAIARMDQDNVFIDQSRERIAGGPQYDPDLTYDMQYYGGLYGHYGYAPYWGAGYMYPGYPYYGAVRPRVW